MRTAILAAVIALLSIAGISQVNQNDPYKISALQSKLAEIDKSNRILPLLLTTQQARSLLIKIETCRQNVRNQEKKEADRLKAMEREIDRVHAEAVEGIVPSQDFITRMRELFKTFASERDQVKTANMIILAEVLESTLNEGQKTAMSKVVEQIYEEHGIPLGNATMNQKMVHFALDILMDDPGYQFLAKLANKR
jgi:hypothetical protein